jgi:hypothetical protein
MSSGFESGAVAFLRCQTVLGVFTAKDANVEFLDFLGLGDTGKQGRGGKNGQQRFHGKSPVGARLRAG